MPPEIETNRLLGAILEQLRKTDPRDGFGVPDLRGADQDNYKIARVNASAALTDHDVPLPKSYMVHVLSWPPSLTTFGIRLNRPDAPVIDLLTYGMRIRSDVPIERIFVTTAPAGGVGAEVTFLSGRVQLDGYMEEPQTLAANNNFGIGCFGRLIAVEGIYKTLNSGGAPQIHRYVFNSGGSFPGEIHVYREINIAHNQGANVDWQGLLSIPTVAGLASYTGKRLHLAVVSGILTNVLREYYQAKAVDDFEAFHQPLIVHDGTQFTVESETQLSSGKVSSIHAIREVYQTNLAITDGSGDVTGTLA